MAPAATAQADALLAGVAEQGGLVLGQVEPGTGVSLDGHPVPVAADGRFLLGFGRDAPSPAVLDITGPGHQPPQRRIITVTPRAWPVQAISGLPPDKAAPDGAASARIRDEAAMIRALRARPATAPCFDGGLTPPAQGIVSGVFGSQRSYNGVAGAPHSGLDIAAEAGQPVWAAAPGTVILAAPDLFLTGATILVDHGLGLMTSYAHLSEITVSPGAWVERGQTIGRVGASGLATGAHLHWGVSWGQVRLDPESAMRTLSMGGATP